MTKKGNLALAATFVAALSGCATQQSMTRQESIDATQRTYEGVSESEFYQAAERLFKLSDEDDTRFSYQGENSMRVQRNWTIYLVLAASFGSHDWVIQTEPTRDGVNGEVYASMNATGVTGAPTGGGGVSAITGPGMTNMINTPAIYGLFWARMDYLLGKSQDWPTCDDWEAKIDRGETYGLIEPLCLAMNTDDLVPDSTPQ